MGGFFLLQQLTSETTSWCSAITSLILSNHQQMAVLSQPDLLLFITWQDAFNEAPVIAGMVPDLHVAQFMDNDKIDHLRRGHDHPPGEGQAVIR